MRRKIAYIISACMFTSAAFAQAPDIPKNTKQLKGDEIPGFLDGKTFSIVVHDAGADLTAVTHWDWAKKKVTGTYVYNGQKGEINNDWTVKGDTNCAEKAANGEWVCQKVFVADGTMYEVNAQGSLHAVSTPK